MHRNETPGGLESEYADIRQRVYRGDIDSPKSVHSVRWAALYGLILTTARALGEFGAVAVVSGRPIAQIDRFLDPLVLCVAGVHGAERRRAVHDPGRRHAPDQREELAVAR